jgi:hypothetical protein
MFRLVILSLIFIVSGCGGEIAYRPNKLEIEDAINIADELIMTQPRAWRPEGFGINEQYISLGFGSVTQANFWRNDKFVTKGTGQRIYYKHIKKIAMKKWYRNFRAWYVVSTHGRGDRDINHLFYSSGREGAETFFDALDTIVNYQFNETPIEPFNKTLNLQNKTE